MYTIYNWGPLLYRSQLNEEDVLKIKSLCKKDVNKDARKDLAGHIDEEYDINKNSLFEIMIPYLKEYSGAFKNWYISRLGSIEMSDPWVNFMKPGEFNPPHIHTSCDLSMVMYLDIPKELKKENEKYLGTLKNGGPGSICFIYGEDSKYVKSTLPIFPDTGDFFIFPSGLKHFVFPFKSNVERISVSANFKIKTIDE
jgi:hypothetical protein